MYFPGNGSEALPMCVPQITLVIWTVIRIGPNGCDSMEFHENGLLRFKQKADMGIVHPLHKSTVGGRKDQDLVLVGNNNPVREKRSPFSWNVAHQAHAVKNGPLLFLFLSRLCSSRAPPS